MFEQAWICEPNDNVSDQGFGEEDMHDWCTSGGWAGAKGYYVKLFVSGNRVLWVLKKQTK